MKAKILGLLAAGLLAGPVSADAASLVIDGSGILTGATDVSVAGSLYNVEFLDGTCEALFGGCDAVSDFEFQNSADALLASEALLSSVFVATAATNYDTDPSKTRGCIAESTECNILTPYMIFLGDANRFNASFALNAVTESKDVTGWVGGALKTLDTGAGYFSNYVFAKWSPAQVPEPGTLALLGLGLAGLGMSRRRKG